MFWVDCVYVWFFCCRVVVVICFSLLCSLLDRCLFFRIFLNLWWNMLLLSRFDLRLCNRLCIVSIVCSLGIWWVICLGLKFFIEWNERFIGNFELLLVKVFLVVILRFGVWLVRMVLKLFLLILIFLCLVSGVCLWFVLKLFVMSSFNGSLIFFWVLFVCKFSVIEIWFFGIFFWKLFICSFYLVMIKYWVGVWCVWCDGFFDMLCVVVVCSMFWLIFYCMVYVCMVKNVLYLYMVNFEWVKVCCLKIIMIKCKKL